MRRKIDSFYDDLKNFYAQIVKTRSRTISTQEFREKALGIYATWKTEIEPTLKTLKMRSNVSSNLDNLFEDVYKEANLRVANVSNLKTKLSEINTLFLKQVLVTSRKEKPSEPTIDLMDSASFLGLNSNWSLATCALQLQEVAVPLLAKRKNIRLDKTSVEALLNKKVQVLSFNDQYEAFSEQVKTSFNVEMPILTTHLRKMRTKVLHEGYNPKPEETESIVNFTIGLLQRLRGISETT
jgi:hypothetical protein